MSAVKTPGVTGLMITGVVLILLGIAALVSPSFSGQTVVYLVGAVLLIGGILHVFQGLKAEGTLRKVTTIAMGVVVAAAGIVVLFNKHFEFALTAILALFFAVEGVVKILTSFSYRPAKGWLGLLAAGLVSFVLAAIIWFNRPWSGVTVVGIFVGIDLVVSGIAMLVVAFTVRQLKKRVKEATAVT